jgi:hypothetical protein
VELMNLIARERGILDNFCWNASVDACKQVSSGCSRPGAMLMGSCTMKHTGMVGACHKPASSGVGHDLLQGLAFLCLVVST